MAPDGAGKTTFLDNLSEKLAFYFVNSSVEERVSIYHFRPSILPNLGAVGEKAKVMKQDTDYSNPHRAKPASTISSLVRISYYWFDYIIGYFLLTRKDLKTYKFTKSAKSIPFTTEKIGKGKVLLHIDYANMRDLKEAILKIDYQ